MWKWLDSLFVVSKYQLKFLGKFIFSRDIRHNFRNPVYISKVEAKHYLQEITAEVLHVVWVYLFLIFLFLFTSSFLNFIKSLKK